MKYEACYHYVWDDPNTGFSRTGHRMFARVDAGSEGEARTLFKQTFETSAASIFIEGIEVKPCLAP